MQASFDHIKLSRNLSISSTVFVGLRAHRIVGFPSADLFFHYFYDVQSKIAVPNFIRPIHSHLLGSAYWAGHTGTRLDRLLFNAIAFISCLSRQIRPQSSKCSCAIFRPQLF